MALNITHTIECHCGADAEMTTMHLDLNPGDRIVIDAELSLGQADFTCPDCGCVTGTGDLYTEIGSKGAECDGDEDQP
jgi:hypothetical protein